MSVLDAFRLDGRIALATGATGGLGEQAALALAWALRFLPLAVRSGPTP